MSGVTRDRLSVGLACLLLILALAGGRAARAGGGGPCGYASDPANSQHRGQQVTVTGTFGEQHQNGAIQVRLRAGGTDYTLAPNGMTDGSGAFEHTVTIPVSTPIGDYALITVGPGPPDNPVICSKPFSVTQGGGFATPTTTTMGLAPPPTTTTTAAPTTTTAAPTTTTVAPTTTTAPEITTTVPDETTTTIEDLLAGDDVTSSGIPLWLLIAFLIAFFVAIFGYVRGRQPRAPGAP